MKGDDTNDSRAGRRLAPWLAAALLASATAASAGVIWRGDFETGDASQ